MISTNARLAPLPLERIFQDLVYLADSIDSLPPGDARIDAEEFVWACVSAWSRFRGVILGLQEDGHAPTSEGERLLAVELWKFSQDKQAVRNGVAQVAAGFPATRRLQALNELAQAALDEPHSEEP